LQVLPLPGKWSGDPTSFSQSHITVSHHKLAVVSHRWSMVITSLVAIKFGVYTKTTFWLLELREIHHSVIPSFFSDWRQKSSKKSVGIVHNDDCQQFSLLLDRQNRHGTVLVSASTTVHSTTAQYTSLCWISIAPPVQTPNGATKLR
jgi:hypothetical protein